MRRLIMAGLALPLTVLPALAQTAPPGPAASPAPSATSPNKAIPEVHAPIVPLAAAPGIPLGTAPIVAAAPRTTASGVPGANSFTEGQAKSRIEAAGYLNVTGLLKDKDGIWRGTATKDGTQAKVGLDYQGNVVTP